MLLRLCKKISDSISLCSYMTNFKIMIINCVSKACLDSKYDPKKWYIWTIILLTFGVWLMYSAKFYITQNWWRSYYITTPILYQVLTHKLPYSIHIYSISTSDIELTKLNYLNYITIIIVIIKLIRFNDYALMITVFCQGRHFATFSLIKSKCRIQNCLGAPFVAYVILNDHCIFLTTYLTHI